VRSRDGFDFVTRYAFSNAPALDRVLVLDGSNAETKAQVVGAWSGIRPEVAAEDLYRSVGRGETACDASFQDLARTQNSSLAAADAQILFYAIAPSQLPGTGWSLAQLLIPLLLSLLGAAAVFMAGRLTSLRRLVRLA